MAAPQPASVTIGSSGWSCSSPGGTRAGPAFVDAVTSPLLPRVLVLTVVAVGVPVVATVLLRTSVVRGLGGGDPRAVLSGALAGAVTQPAALAVAEDRAPATDVLVGYAAVFPVAMVTTIVLGQLLAVLL